MTHWRDNNWHYIPASDHADSTKFRERMEMRRKAAQKETPEDKFLRVQEEKELSPGSHEMFHE